MAGCLPTPAGLCVGLIRGAGVVSGAEGGRLGPRCGATGGYYLSIRFEGGVFGFKVHGLGDGYLRSGPSVPPSQL